eukprot:g688.t1
MEPLRDAYAAFTNPQRIDPVRESSKFIAHYERDYGTPHPPFLQLSFHQAVAQSRAQFKFLVVYVHCREHQDTPTFCKGVLGSQRLLRVIGEEAQDVLVWGGDVFGAEGRSVSHMLNATTFPFLALLSPKSSTSSRKYVLLMQSAGFDSVESVEGLLKNAMQQHRGDVLEVRRQHEEREAQRNLRTSQDAAYLDALRKDREKKAEEERRRDAAEKAEEKAKLEAALELSRRLEAESAIARKKRSLPPEPAADGANVSTFVFRLPNGSRLTRRFGNDEAIEHVFSYLDIALAEDTSGTPISNYAFTAYPHRHFSRDKTDVSKTLGESNLTGRVAVFVQNLDA